MREFSRLSTVFVGAILLFLTLVVADAAGVPRQFNYQGYLRDSDANPVNDLVNFQFYIYPDSTGGSPCWGPESFVDVEVVAGFFELQLGSKVPIDPDCFDGSRKWLDIWVNGAPLYPRKPISSVPYAFASTSGGVGGSGTQGFLPRFADGMTLEDSQIFDDGTSVGIGTTSPGEKLDIEGNVNAVAYYGDGSKLTGIASALRTYDSGWFPVEGSTEYTLTHGLGTTRVLALMYSATDSNGSQMQLEGIVGYADLGITIATITTTQVTIYVQYKFNWINDYRAGITSGYARVMMLALE